MAQRRVAPRHDEQVTDPAGPHVEVAARSGPVCTRSSLDRLPAVERRRSGRTGAGRPIPAVIAQTPLSAVPQPAAGLTWMIRRSLSVPSGASTGSATSAGSSRLSTTRQIGVPWAPSACSRIRPRRDVAPGP